MTELFTLNKTIYEYLRDYEETCTDAIFWAEETETWTIDVILEKVKEYAVGLNRIGIERGMKVVLRMERNISSVIMLLSVMAIGAEALLVSEKTNVLDFFNDDCYSSMKGYITRENNSGWVCVSLTDVDRDIIPETGTFSVCNDLYAPVVVLKTMLNGRTIKQKFSQHDLLKELYDMKSNAVCRKNDRMLAVLPLYTEFGIKVFLYALIAGCSLIFPKMFGNRHLLHCVEAYRVSAFCAADINLEEMMKYSGEYCLSSLKCIVVSEQEVTAALADGIQENLTAELIIL